MGSERENRKDPPVWMGFLYFAPKEQGKEDRGGEEILQHSTSNSLRNPPSGVPVNISQDLSGLPRRNASLAMLF